MPDENLATIEMMEEAYQVSTKKVSYPLKRTIILSILAGMYVGFGGLMMILVGTGSSILPIGIVKVLMGLVFTLGLVLVVIGGGELFTGNTIIGLAKARKQISWGQVIINWAIVYFGNFLGAVILAFLILGSKQYTFFGGAIGETMFKVASFKLGHTFFSALILGFLCNIFVCLAIWLTYSSKKVLDKIICIIFPITAFAALGFEHSVANMYLLSSAWLIQIFDSSFALNHAIKEITLNQIFIGNLLPVTIGNIFGGLFVWFAYHFAYKK